MYDSYNAAVVQERVAELFREAEQARLVRAARKARRHRRWWRYNGGLAPQWARANDIGRRRDDRPAALSPRRI